MPNCETRIFGVAPNKLGSSVPPTAARLSAAGMLPANSPRSVRPPHCSTYSSMAAENALIVSISDGLFAHIKSERLSSSRGSPANAPQGEFCVRSQKDRSSAWSRLACASEFSAASALAAALPLYWRPLSSQQRDDLLPTFRGRKPSQPNVTHPLSPRGPRGSWDSIAAKATWHTPTCPRGDFSLFSALGFECAMVLRRR